MKTSNSSKKGLSFLVLNKDADGSNLEENMQALTTQSIPTMKLRIRRGTRA